MKSRYIISTLFLTAFSPLLSAENMQESKQDPWVFTPLFSSDPKMGVNAGALAAYMYQFDEQSPDSMFGTKLSYSETKSWTAVLFGQAFLDSDRQRITAAIGQGQIRNDYQDYLGSGVNVKTTDELSFYIVRYAYQMWEKWFTGVQLIHSGYNVTGLDDVFSQLVNIMPDNVNFESSGLSGFDSTGVGITLEYDSRDNQYFATKGHYFILHNIAYRKSLSGDYDFDVYDSSFVTYLKNFDTNILAINISGRWTNDAPSSGYSSVFTRGYVRGQYIAPHITSIEFDERIMLTDKWGATVYGSLSCLYGEIKTQTLKCTNKENLYPSVALGVSYALKPENGLYLRAEAGLGKEGNHGFYLTFGQPF